jgi:hypothetical protein
MKRMKTTVGVFFLIAGFCSCVWAAPSDKALFNVTISVGWEGHVRMAEWSPIEVMISSQYEEPFIGSIEISMAQDSQHRLVLHKPLVVQPAQTIRVPIVSKMSRSSDQCRIRMIGRDGSVYLNQVFDLMNYSQGMPNLDLVDSRQTFIAVTGKTGIAFDLDEINKDEEQVVGCRMFTPMLPHTWVGYSGLDVLVLNDPDYAQMNLAQIQALSQWISNGGNAIIVMGTKSIPADSDLGKLVTFKIEPPKTMTISSESLDTWKLVKSKENAMTPGWVIDPKMVPPEWRIAVKDRNGNPLILEGRVGFGKVRLLTFDPQTLVWPDEKERKKFWLGQLGHMIDLEKFKKKEDEQQKWKYSRTLSLQDAGQNSILGYLLRISGLRPISIWSVLMVLGVMGLLIGPVDYLVLKKMNKLPWTYVTFFSILTVFTVGAYYGVQYWRAGDDQLRRLAVVDKIDGTSCCWQTGFTCIFASKSDDFIMTGQQPMSWWSGLGLNTEWYGSGRGILSNVVCLQQDGNIPVSMPINIWSVRTLLDQEPMEKSAFPISAEVELNGEQIRAKITNHGHVPIEQGMVRVKAGWIMFTKPIAPEETRLVEGQVEKNNSSWMKSDDKPLEDYQYHMGNIYEHWLVLSARGVLPRTQGIEGRIEQGDAVIYAVSEEGPSCPLQFKDKPVKTTSKTYYRLVIPHVQQGSQS